MTNKLLYPILIFLFICAFAGVFFTNSLILIVCSWQAAYFLSFILGNLCIGGRVDEGQKRAFVFDLFILALLAISLSVIYREYGTLNLRLLRGQTINPAAFFIFLAALISKGLLLLIQGSQAKDKNGSYSRVPAIFYNAVLLYLGAFIFYRLVGVTFILTDLAREVSIGLALALVISGAMSALRAIDLKRLLGYSCLSQLGFIMLGIFLNTEFSSNIGLVYIISYFLAGSGIFLGICIIEDKVSTSRLDYLGGLIKDLPVLGGGFILCALSLIGIPPFLGSYPKIMLELSELRAGNFLVPALGILGAVLTLFYIMRIFNKVFLGPVKLKLQGSSRSGISVLVVVLGILSLALGFIPSMIFNINLF